MDTQAQYKIIRTFQHKPDRWYTGLAIKKYIKERIFSLNDEPVFNPSVESGRWSAYAHYSRKQSFINMLDKQQIGENSDVIVHPLLPPELVNELMKRKANLHTVDISPNDFAFDVDKTKQFIRLLSANTKIAAIIHYDITGIVSTVQELILQAQSLSIPSILVIESEIIHDELLDLFAVHTLGGVVWVGNSGIVEKNLNDVLTEPIEFKQVYLSWYFETRARSLLEYHLSTSHEKFQALVQAYIFLFTEKLQVKRSPKEWFQKLVLKNIYTSKDFTSVDEAEKVIHTEYRELNECAIPDLFWEFELETEFEPIDILHSDLLLRQKATALISKITSICSNIASSEYQIPLFQREKTYVYIPMLAKDTSVLAQSIPGFGISYHPWWYEKKDMAQAKLAADFAYLVPVSI